MPDEVRTAIERLMVDYCHHLDALGDAEPLLALFTPDAVVDMTALGMPLFEGHAGLRSFFDGVKAGLSHSFHMIGNFRPESWDGAVAVMTAYVQGMGQPKDGARVVMQVRYRMECVAAADGWQCRRYTVTPMMPPVA
jgi:ketosteroid isomerase-like protein